MKYFALIDGHVGFEFMLFFLEADNSFKDIYYSLEWY